MRDKPDVIHASCLCGGIAFTLGRPVLSMSNCHCSMCRRQHGTAFSTYVQCHRAAVQLTQGQELLATYASSDHVKRQFCGVCGAKLFYLADAHPQTVWVAAGVLDDDPEITACQHIFVASKAPWYEICDDLPCHDRFPDAHDS
jgi:hypothetical protein